MLQLYQRRKDELSIYASCILLGSRVIVPPAGRQKIMEELHQGHPGITRVKGLARGFVWWPGMDLDPKNMVKQCPNCQVNQNHLQLPHYIVATTSMNQATPRITRNG